LTIARFLGEKHNRFVNRVDEALLTRGRERQTTRQGVVSSKFFSSAHSLSYDLAGGFLPFVEKQCVQYSSSGNVVYDFRKAEQYLLDVYFSSKPLIDLEVRMVQYANMQSEGTSQLKQKVKQEALSKDTCDKIVKELGSASRARQCLELLETCISFLQATGGSFVQTLDVGEKKLGEYVKTVLMMDEAEFGSRLIGDVVRLKHIDSLWRLLREYTVVDPFEAVRPKYKEPLDEKLAASLTHACEKLDTRTLLPCLRDFIEEILTEDYMNVAATIKEMIGQRAVGDPPSYLESFEWFNEFPSDIFMKNIVAAYHCIERAAVI